MRKSSDWCKLILIYKSTAEWVKTQVWTTPVCLSLSLIHLFLSQCCATVTRLCPSDIITEACCSSWLTDITLFLWCHQWPHLFCCLSFSPRHHLGHLPPSQWHSHLSLPLWHHQWHLSLSLQLLMPRLLRCDWLRSCAALPDDSWTK